MPVFLIPPARGWQATLKRLVAMLVAVVLVVAAFLFSLVVLGVLLLVGTVVGIWWWWQTRELRRVLRERHAARGDAVVPQGEIIEGEIIREDPPNPRLPH